MEWPEALDLVVARTRHERYRDLCREDNPDPAQRDGIRALMVRMATDAPTPAYPPALEIVGNFFSSLATAARSGFRLADRKERERRRGICTACPLFDPAQRRCTACGCFAALKPWLADVGCPQGRWAEPDVAVG